MIVFLLRFWKPLALVLLVSLAFVGGVTYLHHITTEAFNRGFAQARAEDEAQAQKVLAQNEAKVAQAEHIHDEEINGLRAYQLGHPLPQLRLCNKPAGNPQLPATPGNGSGVAAPTEAQPIQPMPGRDSESGSERDASLTRLLQLLAGRADLLSAQARELQKRVQE